MALDLGDLEYRVRVDTSDLNRAERAMRQKFGLKPQGR